MDQVLEEKIKKADNLIYKNPDKAVTAIKEILKERINLIEDEAYLYYLLSVARTKCGRFFLAKQAIEKSIELLPNSPENLGHSGWVKFMLGDTKEGRNDLRKAISLDLMNPKFYADLAVTYLRDCDFKESREWANRAKALDSHDQFLIKTIKMIDQTEKDFNNFSQSDKERIKEGNKNPKVQANHRMAILESYSYKKALTKDEAEEVKEEARLNGVSAAIIKDDQEDWIGLKNKNASEKVKEILNKRKSIEKELSRMLIRVKSPFMVERIKDIIWHEKDDNDLTKIISVFDKGVGISELNKILDIINDAWNYFPHKSLNGLCPMEKILEYQDKNKN